MAAAAKEPSRVTLDVTVPGNVMLETWVRRIGDATQLKVDGALVTAKASPEGYLMVTLSGGQHTVETV